MTNYSIVDEFIKLAGLGNEYKKVKVDGKTVYLRKGIPVIGRMPRDPDKALMKLIQVTSSEGKKKGKVLGYHNVAVRAKAMPDMVDMGFQGTRIATPLPGEKPLQVSWRSGKIHAHKQGPLYLVHQDRHAPIRNRATGKRGSRVSHLVTEGIPSVVRRLRDRSPLVIEKTSAKKGEKWKEWSREEGRIYDPGVVAHEAGHSSLHRRTPLVGAVRTLGEAISTLGPAVYSGIQMAGDKGIKKAPLLAMRLGGQVPKLTDEAYASIKGYNELARSEKYTKKEMGQVRNKLMAAYGSYLIGPASSAIAIGMLNEGKVNDPKRIIASIALPLVADIAGNFVASKMRHGAGPAITAKRAKELARKIAPGVDVYATDVPISDGSFAVDAAPMGLEKAYETMLNPFIEDEKDKARLARKGGIVIAPMRHVPRGKRI